MKLAIVVALSSNVTPLLAVVSPLSYHDFPVLLIIEIRVPAGIVAVILISFDIPSTENSASNIVSAAGLLAPNVSLYTVIGSFRNLRPAANTSISSHGPNSAGIVTRVHAVDLVDLLE